MLSAISKWRDERAYQKLCKFLLRRFGRPEWYSPAQVLLGIKETRTGRLTDSAPYVLSDDNSVKAVEEKEAFLQLFLEGRRKFNAQHVVRNFLGTQGYSKWANPDQPDVTMTGAYTD